jgi:D-alanyl-lipoteichoic acid acyltransferase DltB (MBOAT superfamily)
MRLTIKLGINIILMIDLIKLHMICQNYADGALLDIKEEEGKFKLSPRERHYALRELPSFSAYVHYFNYCGSALFGPACEFRDFDDLINLREPFSQMRTFSNFVPALTRYAQGFLIVFASIIYSKHVDISYLLTSEFGERSYMFKFFYIFLSQQCKVLHLFSGFTWMEAFCIASGIGYRAAKSKDEPETFNNLRCGKFRQYVFAYKFAPATEGWNTSAHKWLKYYVIARLYDREKPRSAVQVLPILGTFCVSALWHGIYRGYWNFFVGIAFLDMMSRAVQQTQLAH